MSDRELLELAAKAYGLENHVYVADCGMRELLVHGVSHGGYQGSIFNPLTDDGDALRLAVKLGLCILIESGHVVCTRYYAEPQKLTPHGERLGDNSAASTRRAIVRAAAEIGSNMP